MTKFKALNEIKNRSQSIILLNFYVNIKTEYFVTFICFSLNEVNEFKKMHLFTLTLFL